MGEAKPKTARYKGSPREVALAALTRHTKPAPLEETSRDHQGRSPSRCGSAYLSRSVPNESLFFLSVVSHFTRTGNRATRFLGGERCRLRWLRFLRRMGGRRGNDASSRGDRWGEPAPACNTRFFFFLVLLKEEG